MPETRCICPCHGPMVDADSCSSCEDEERNHRPIAESTWVTFDRNEYLRTGNLRRRPISPHPITTPFERMWGIPPERVGITRPTNRDLAVEARRGGRLIILMYRHAIYAPICPLLNISEFGRRSDRDMARGASHA